MIRYKRYEKAYKHVLSLISQELCAGRGDWVGRASRLHFMRMATVKFNLNKGELRKLQRDIK